MFGETEHDSSQQLTSVPIEEQLDAFGRVLDVGKVCCMRYACKIRSLTYMFKVFSCYTCEITSSTYVLKIFSYRTHSEWPAIMLACSQICWT